jgi:general secretion pathway protein G
MRRRIAVFRACPGGLRRAGRFDAARRDPHDAGFTLLELLIVIAILGLLAVVGTVQLVDYLGRAKTDTARLQVDQLALALDLFRIDVGRLPTSEEGLKALTAAPAGLGRWRGPYLRKIEALVDPWGTPFVYRRPGQHGEYDLVSYGADGKPGGSGEDLDVANWREQK